MLGDVRAIWKGSISFGLVSVPVKAYAATEDHDVRFHQVHAEDIAHHAHYSEDTCLDNGNGMQQGAHRGGCNHGRRKPGVKGHPGRLHKSQEEGQEQAGYDHGRG